MRRQNKTRLHERSTYEDANGCAQMWQRIPDDTDILITHGPPLGVMDREHCGDEFLLRHVVDRVKPKAHVFGHIHDGYGMGEYEGTTFVNCAQLNDFYELVNKPVEVEI